MTELTKGSPAPHKPAQKQVVKHCPTEARECSDADFAKREDSQDAAQRQPIDEGSPSQAADAEPEQKGADDHRRSDRVGPGKGAEHALPGGLIGESTEPGEKEQSEKEQHHPAPVFHPGCGKCGRPTGLDRHRANPPRKAGEITMNSSRKVLSSRSRISVPARVGSH
jgi:hypothetical protein